MPGYRRREPEKTLLHAVIRDRLERAAKVLVQFDDQSESEADALAALRLASAIAGLLAQGAALEEAVRGGRGVVERYLDAAAG